MTGPIALAIALAFFLVAVPVQAREPASASDSIAASQISGCYRLILPGYNGLVEPPAPLEFRLLLASDSTIRGFPWIASPLPLLPATPDLPRGAWTPFANGDSLRVVWSKWRMEVTVLLLAVSQDTLRGVLSKSTDAGFYPVDPVDHIKNVRAVRIDCP
jgi:hypothetical protein